MSQPVLSSFQFPNIYRFITELPRERKVLYLKITVVSFVSGFLVMATALKGYALADALSVIRIARAQESQMRKEKTYWEEVVKRHKGYRDAYFKLAVLSFHLGEKDKAKEYLHEVFLIDPNFQQGRDFAEEVGLAE